MSDALATPIIVTIARLTSTLASIAVGACIVFMVAAAAVAGPLEDRLKANESRQNGIESKIDKSEAKEEVLTEKIAEFRQQITELNGPIAELDSEIAGLEQRIQAGEERIKRLQAERAALTKRIVRLEAELEVAERRLLSRLVEIYTTGEANVGEIFVESGGFTEFVDRQETMTLVAEQDDKVMESVKELRAAVARDRQKTRDLENQAVQQVKAVEADKADVSEKRTVLVAKRTELEGVKSKRETYLGKIQDRQGDLQEDLAALEKANEALESAIAAGQQSFLPGGTYNGPSPAGFIWPVNGPVVSGFGPRWGRLHAGIDIAVPAGVPIYAAAAGMVTYSGPMSGYGNLVIVQHGGNIATAYAHQSQIVAPIGQVVEQGQLLGYIGCTGHCYGDHLHLEFRVGGAATDPLQFL